MAVLFYVSLLFIPLTAEVYPNRNVVGKYGCVFSPNVCVPPEDCNGITGHCQISSRETGKGYRDEDRDVSRIFEAMRSYDYNDSPSHKSDPGFSLDTETNSLEALVKTSQGSFPHVSHSVDSNYEVAGQQHRTKHGTRQLINKHLDEFQYALAQRGRKLADLTTDELRVIVKYLANVIRNEQSSNFDEPYQYGGSKQDPESNLKHEDYGVLLQDSMHTYEDIDSPVQAMGITLEHKDATGKESIQKTGDIPRDGIEMEVAESTNTKSSNFDTTSDPTAQSTIQKETLYIVIIVVGATVLLIVVVSITSCAYYTYRKKKQQDIKFMQSMASGQPVGSEYQDLCRQHFANKNCEVEDGSDSDGNFQEYSASSPRFADHEHKGYEPIRNSSVSSMSWSEEPATASLDIATGHKVLDYMENHLNNKDRLAQEWQDLCKSKPDEYTMEVAKLPLNMSKNRIDAALPYDYNRVKLNAAENHVESDYINASKVIDSDPKRPLYIAAQGPLLSTVSDFWQMVWEHDCVAIVMLTALVEDGMSQCARYWPDEGSSKYHNFEINLVSEHIWCEHYLVRSLYVKHLVTRETRTITQFHFLSWPKNSIPSTPKHLLELRRKVSKCSKAHHSPVLVHCSDGVGRTGTYILLDLVINRLLKRPLEIDIAATLEHIRDMRAGMVANKDQFEFALTAVAEEVNAAINTTKA